MWLTDLLGVVSLVVAIVVFYHGDPMSSYLLVLIGYLFFTTAANESEISRLKDEIGKIGKRNHIVTERQPHLTIS